MISKYSYEKRATVHYIHIISIANLILLDQAKLNTRKLGTDFDTEGDSGLLRSLACKDSGNQRAVLLTTMYNKDS